MPRRPPARLRAQQDRYLPSWWRRRPLPRIPGASGALQAAVVRLELADARLSPGDIAAAFLRWRRKAYGPSRRIRTGSAPSGDCCDCCPPQPGRETLELALHRLPKQAARELRRLLTPLDDELLRRTVPLPRPPESPWWTHRA